VLVLGLLLVLLMLRHHGLLVQLHVQVGVDLVLIHCGESH
jgi:hypothetical protein